MPPTGAAANKNQDRAQHRRIKTIKANTKAKAERFRTAMTARKRDRMSDATIADAINATLGDTSKDHVAPRTLDNCWAVLGIDPVKLKNSRLPSGYSRRQGTEVSRLK